MKLSKRAFLIIATAVAAVGLILVSVSFVMADGNFKRLSNREPYEEKSYSASADIINKISLNNNNSNVKIVKSADDKIHIDYSENNKEYYTFNVSADGELTIDFKSNLKWYDHIGIDFDSRGVFKIAVPDDMACDFSIRTSNGGISVESVSAKGDFSLSTSNGDIALTDLSADGSVISDTSNGEISAARLAAASVAMHTSNGKLILTDLVCQKDIDAETSNNKVQISNISVGTALKIRSSNGDIDGTVNGSIGNFNITSRTSNGNNSLPESLTGGTKDLDVATSNGNIKITFAAR